MIAVLAWSQALGWNPGKDASIGRARESEVARLERSKIMRARFAAVSKRAGGWDLGIPFYTCSSTGQDP